MTFPEDIAARIDARFKDGTRVRDSLAQVSEIRDRERIWRCVLELSESDYDAVDAWVKKANADYRDVIYYAEYDNREVRRFDFSRSYDEQVPYSYPQ